MSFLANAWLMFAHSSVSMLALLLEVSSKSGVLRVPRVCSLSLVPHYRVTAPLHICAVPLAPFRAAFRDSNVEHSDRVAIAQRGRAKGSKSMTALQGGIDAHEWLRCEEQASRLLPLRRAKASMWCEVNEAVKGAWCVPTSCAQRQHCHSQQPKTKTTYCLHLRSWVPSIGA